MNAEYRQQEKQVNKKVRMVGNIVGLQLLYKCKNLCYCPSEGRSTSAHTFPELRPGLYLAAPVT